MSDIITHSFSLRVVELQAEKFEEIFNSNIFDLINTRVQKLKIIIKCKPSDELKKIVGMTHH